MIVANFSYRKDGETELSHVEKTLTNHQQICDAIDSYPWLREIELTNELGEGGGMDFLIGDAEGANAFYRLIPLEKDVVMFSLEVYLEKGFLGIFGRKVLYKDFGDVSIDEAKEALKNIFDHSVESLYQKYKK